MLGIGKICEILASLLSLLPDSFVQGIVDDLESVDTFLGFLNFFIPFDICAAIFQAWLLAMTAYLVYNVLSDKLWRLLL